MDAVARVWSHDEGWDALLGSLFTKSSLTAEEMLAFRHLTARNKGRGGDRELVAADLKAGLLHLEGKDDEAIASLAAIDRARPTAETLERYAGALARA